MNLIKLNGDYSFGVEKSGKNLRLIVYNNGVEKVCRKYSPKRLRDLLQSNDNQLFKGRLQLFKDEVGINIDVKGELVGRITTDSFQNCLNSTGLI